MIDALGLRRPFAPRRGHLAATLTLSLLLSLLAASPALGAATAPSESPTSTLASPTPASMATSILGWLNRDRGTAGLRPLRSWPALQAIATGRAAALAASRTLSHQAAGGDPGAALTAHGIDWLSFGETIGETSYAWGSPAAANLYGMWKASPEHHAILFSGTLNYIGIGIARASDGSTWASMLFSESADHTPPVARNGTLTRSGTSVTFRWSGSDPLLQTHTAGLAGFNVEYRVNGGAWRLIRSRTTMTWLGLTHRTPGATYSFRVQAVDRRGNLSAWTAEKRVRIP